MTLSVSGACLIVEMIIIAMITIAIIDHFPGLQRDSKKVMFADCTAQIPIHISAC